MPEEKRDEGQIHYVIMDFNDSKWIHWMNLKAPMSREDTEKFVKLMNQTCDNITFSVPKYTYNVHN